MHSSIYLLQTFSTPRGISRGSNIKTITMKKKKKVYWVMSRHCCKCSEYIIYIHIILTKKLWGRLLILSSSYLRWEKELLEKMSILPKLIMVKAGAEARHSDSKPILIHFTASHTGFAFTASLVWRSVGPFLAFFYALLCSTASLYHTPEWSYILRCFLSLNT